MIRFATLAAALASLGACFHPSYDHPACGPDRECPSGLVCGADNVCGEAEAQRDAGVAPDAQSCYGSGIVHVCFNAPPTGDVVVSSSSTFDTSVDANCTKIVAQNGGPELCVFAAGTITASGQYTVVGTRPLVVIAATSIAIPSGATIDASSRSASSRKGPGANDVGDPNKETCARAAGTGDANGGGGGAGGSFGTVGGAGGEGSMVDTGAPGAVASAATPMPKVLRGGCAGTPGGIGMPGTVGGPPGDGGGAVFLIAGSSISIAGAVFASGGGGGNTATIAGANAGGGGGGAGGMIGFEAPLISITGTVAANGGAGGGGGNVQRGGEYGGDGTTSGWNTRALGGIGAGAQPGDGGQGTTFSDTSGFRGSASNHGGGGGGGGLGLVWFYGALTGGTMISPTPVMKPLGLLYPP